MVYNTCLGQKIFTIGLPAECDMEEASENVKTAAKDAIDTLKSFSEGAANNIKSASEGAAETIKAVAEDAVKNIKCVTDESIQAVKIAASSATGAIKDFVDPPKKPESNTASVGVSLLLVGLLTWGVYKAYKHFNPSTDTLQDQIMENKKKAERITSN